MSQVAEAFCDCCKRMTPDCQVMAELRRYRTKEGRASLVAEYREEVVRRQGKLATNPEDEAWRHAQKAGVPFDALVTLKRKPEDTLALSAARKFVEVREALFLLLLGPKGVGKTVAAAHVVLELCRKWEWNSQPTGGIIHPVQYVDASTLTRMSAYESTDKDRVAAYQSAPLLVLEDAGDEGTELGRGVFVELLMTRHARLRRTVICSNLVGGAFTKRYGEAVSDRIRSTGIIPLLAAVKSMRQKPRFA